MNFLGSVYFVKQTLKRKETETKKERDRERSAEQ
jgi:hypothetical protein